MSRSDWITVACTFMGALLSLLLGKTAWVIIFSGLTVLAFAKAFLMGRAEKAEAAAKEREAAAVKEVASKVREAAVMRLFADARATYPGILPALMPTEDLRPTFEKLSRDGILRPTGDGRYQEVPASGGGGTYGKSTY